MIDPEIINLLSGSKQLIEWPLLDQVPAMADKGGADTGGPNPLPHGKSIWTPGKPPALTTGMPIPASLIFTPIKRSPGQPWDNCYNFNTITRQPLKSTYFSWELEFSISAMDLKGNAREFEIELCESGWTYNMAWQYKCSKVDGPPAWRLFDQNAARNKWVPVVSIPAPAPKAGTFISVKAFFAINRSVGTTLHDSIMIDGIFYPVDAIHERKQKWSPQTNYLHNAVQIDSMGDGIPCSVQIRNWKVRAL